MDANAKKTTLHMIPYGLYFLTAETGDSVGSGTVNWVSQMSFEPPLLAIGDHAVVVVEVTDVGLREDEPQMLTLSELGLNYGG